MGQVVRVSLWDGNRMRVNDGETGARAVEFNFTLAIAKERKRKRDSDRRFDYLSQHSRPNNRVFAHFTDSRHNIISTLPPFFLGRLYSRHQHFSYRYFRRFFISLAHRQLLLAPTLCPYLVARRRTVKSTKKESNPRAHGWVGGD